jgi:hypothetical protein
VAHERSEEAITAIKLYVLVLETPIALDSQPPRISVSTTSSLYLFPLL